MASPEDLRNDVTVLIPQRLIDMAMRSSATVKEEIVPYDEGLPIEQPLYLEEEPRLFGFGRLLLISAIVGSIVVFTGLQVADSHAPATLSERSVSSGVESMSAAELIQSIKAENRTVYWLNAKQGDSYANESSANGIDQITYRPAGADVSDLAQFDVIVGTYKDYSTYDAHPHPLLGFLQSRRPCGSPPVCRGFCRPRPIANGPSAASVMRALTVCSQGGIQVIDNIAPQSVSVDWVWLLDGNRT